MELLPNRKRKKDHPQDENHDGLEGQLSGRPLKSLADPRSFLQDSVITADTNPTPIKHPPSGPIFFGRWVQAISYLGVCAWLIWIATADESESELAAKLDQIVFTDFFGYFLIALFFPDSDRSIRWGRLMTSGDFFRFLGYGLLVLFAGYFMEGIAGLPFTIIWMLGLMVSLSDISGLKSGAIIRVAWAMISAFLVALVASIAGVPAELEIAEHFPSVFAWGLLYFGGVAVFRIVRILVS